MKEITGKIFSIAEENLPISGCTISKNIYNDDKISITYYSLAKDTDISPESYNYPKIFIVNSGIMEIYTNEKIIATISENEMIVLPVETPVGIRTSNHCIYTEIIITKERNMNKILQDGTIIKLSELLPYQDGKIINMDLINEEKFKFVIMSFDAGTGLSEHSAPGEALIFALAGNATIGYEDKEYKIKSGENFKFAKNAKHYIKADSKFKMALLLTLE